MASYTINPTDTNSYAVTEDGVMAATKFPNTASSYGNIAATYHNSVTSTWLGEVEDFGLVLSGQWTGTATVADISGSHISYLGNSLDNSTWNYPAGLSQKLNARFAKMKHESLTTSTLKVTMPTQNIRVDAVPREEVGTSTSSASGPVTITLTNQYVAVKKITITPQGTTARSSTFDRIVLAPVPGLSMSSTSAGGGNSYVLQNISNIARVIASGDYLEYDYYDAKVPPSVTDSVGGMDITFTDATRGYTFLPNCMLGTGNLGAPVLSYGTWRSRKFDLTAAVGKTTSIFNLMRESDTAGDYQSIYRNIRITDGAGTTRLQIWASGEPTINQLSYMNLSSNVQCGPANSFQCYIFDQSGAKIASPFSYDFQGV
jgi:hypothetical protein